MVILVTLLLLIVFIVIVYGDAYYNATQSSAFFPGFCSILMSVFAGYGAGEIIKSIIDLVFH